MTDPAKRVRDEAAAVRAILHGEWDPISCGVPADEYDSYVFPVLALLKRGAARSEISDYLRWAADEAMSSPVPPEKRDRIVALLIALDLKA